MGKFYRPKKTVSSETDKQCDAPEREARVSSRLAFIFSLKLTLTGSTKEREVGRSISCI